SGVPEGHRTHHGRGLCRPCYSRNYKAAQIHKWPLLKRRQRVCRKPDCGFCEDMRWLAETGATPHEWVTRMGSTSVALARRLYRHGLYEWASQVERLRNTEPNRRKAA